MCDFRNSAPAPLKAENLTPLDPENIALGVGSDESIDALIRVFCKPGSDKLLTCPPTYGMYSVSAQINDVEVVKIPMLFNKGNFQIDTDKIMETLSNDPSIKLVYVTSPGNPTATLIEPARIEKLLNHPTWNGIVIVDEAYIDFCPSGSSFAPLVTKYPNLAVMQTLSKAFGLAGVRLGFTFADKSVAHLLNNMRAPYNISIPTAQLGERALSKAGLAVMKSNVAKILEERSRIIKALKGMDGVGEMVSGEDANFILVEILDKETKQPSTPAALKLYIYLAEKKQVIVRFRGKEPGCTGCLRISIGTKEENDTLLKEFEQGLKTL